MEATIQDFTGFISFFDSPALVEIDRSGRGWYPKVYTFFTKSGAEIAGLDPARPALGGGRGTRMA